MSERSRYQKDKEDIAREIYFIVNLFIEIDDEEDFVTMDKMLRDGANNRNKFITVGLGLCGTRFIPKTLRSGNYTEKQHLIMDNSIADTYSNLTGKARDDDYPSTVIRELKAIIDVVNGSMHISDKCDYVNACNTILKLRLIGDKLTIYSDDPETETDGYNHTLKGMIK